MRVSDWCYASLSLSDLQRVENLSSPGKTCSSVAAYYQYGSKYAFAVSLSQIVERCGLACMMGSQIFP